MHECIKDLITEITTDAIKYWERKRIWYNLYLLIPSSLGFMFSQGMSIGIGDKINNDTTQILLMFAFSAILANLAYSTAYIVDFFVQLSEYKEGWRKKRFALFALGCLISFPLAFGTAFRIALKQ
jgi:hypothetical protein